MATKADIQREEILATVHQISDKVNRLSTSIDRIELIVIGDGVTGLVDRVGQLEGAVTVGRESLAARISRIEHKVDTIGRVMWLVASAAVGTVVAAAMRLILK